MAHRTFSDARGVAWDVWDVIPRLAPSDSQRELGYATISGPLAQGWLAFQAGESRRRLTPVPEGWDQATDEELRRWCNDAEAVVPRQRQPSPSSSSALPQPPVRPLLIEDSTEHRPARQDFLRSEGGARSA